MFTNNNAVIGCSSVVTTTLFYVFNATTEEWTHEKIQVIAVSPYLMGGVANG